MPATEPESTTILQVSAYENGGAGTVMMDLHREYERRGLDSWVAVGTKQGAEPRVLEIPNEAARSRWSRMLANAARSGLAGSAARALAAKALLVASDPQRYLAILAGVEDFAFPASRDVIGLPPRAPDVLHFHNLHGYYFDLRVLPEVSRRVPTVLTLHDAWLLTGHCAHPFDCIRWKTGCGDCPDLGMYVPISKDASARNWQLKRDIVRRSRIGLVSPSRWLLGMVEETLPLGVDLRATVIPNGVDVSVFCPGNRQAARRELALPPDATVLFTAAELLAGNPFKDFATLAAALPRIAKAHAGRLLLVAVGGSRAVDPIPGVEIVTVPFVDNVARMALYHQAADVYVHAARAENLPLTIIEAMACGTPVVASDVGGIGELVVDGATGSLVVPSDPRAFARAVGTLLDRADLRAEYGRAGLKRVQAHFTLSRQADAYLEHYAELREAWATGR